MARITSYNVCYTKLLRAAEGGTKYTFKLRKDVKFHDGTPMTSADVKGTFDKIIFPPEGIVSDRKAMYFMVKAVETPDPSTVVFRLKFATEAFLPALANPSYNFV